MKTYKKCLWLVLMALFLLPTTGFAKDGDIKICGTIQSIDAAQVTLNNISYPLGSGVEYEDTDGSRLSRSDFLVGELVELRIRNGQVDQLEKEDEANCGGGSIGGSDDDNSSGSDDDSDDSSDDSGKGDDDSSDDSSSGSGGSKADRERFCGQITAISDSTLTVGQRELEVTAGTEFESRAGTPLTFSAFAVGDFVKVDIRNGALHEVEFDSSSSCRSQKVADSQKSSSSSSTRETSARSKVLKTRLSASDGVLTRARGQAKYKSRAKNGKGKDRFQLKVKIPVPSTFPSLSGVDDARSLQLSAFIQRGSETLAVCELEFDEIEDGVAEYKVDLRESSGSVRAKKGSCDVDLSQTGIQNAVPPLLSGDDITVVPADLSSFLEGQF